MQITKKDQGLPEIHPTAIIGSGAQIGENAEVGPYSIIAEDVIVGSNTRIGPYVQIEGGTRIGDNCEVHHGAVLGTRPQDLKYEDEKTTLEIGHNSIIREYCTIHRGTKNRLRTVIGSDCMLMAYSHVAHDCILGDHVLLANAVNMAGHVVIQDYVGVGGLVPIHQFVRIGRHAFIGGGYRVPKDIPPYVLAAGEPLKFAGVNSVGLSRRGFSSEIIGGIRQAYKIFYRSNLNVSQAISRIKDEMEIKGEIKDIVDFIEESERGVMK